jgi:hypothetical protein
MTINLGSIHIPINAATKTFAILAKRGAGKTYTGAVMAEEFYKNNIPFVVFDPIDVWWGLRLAANGTDTGIPVVVFGVEHADIPLHRDMGRDIARAIVKENVSCIINTFGIPKAAQRHLIAEFSEELLTINNTARHVFIEEAHEFLPQRVFGGLGKTFNAVSNLVVMGRNRSIGVTLINQRAATINKDVLTQLDTLLAFQNVSPQDRSALKDWVEYHAADGDFEKFMKSLPSLPKGEGWVWSPEFLGKFERIKIRKRETFHPESEKIGTKFVMPHLTQADIQGFIATFNASSKGTKGKIKEEAIQPVTPVPAPEPIKFIAMRNEYESQLMQKDVEIRKRDDIIEQIRRLVLNVPDTPLPNFSTGKHDALIENLPKYEKDIMKAIKQHPNIPFTRSQLAVKSNKSYTSSAFPVAIRRLVKLQLLEEHGKDFIYRGK